MFCGMFWDLQQNRRIGEVESSARRSMKKAIDVAQEIRSLEARIDKLCLINLAICSVLQERGLLDEETLMERVRQIDMQDGRADGKLKQPGNIRRCPKCGRTMSPRHGRCLYCGCEDLQAEPFDGVL